MECLQFFSGDWLARRVSAVDALVAAFAEPGGTVLTSDPDDLEALAAHAPA
jgi:predicted nucleic acid-binding protein